MFWNLKPKWHRIMVRFRNGQVTDVNQLINVKWMNCPTDEAGAVVEVLGHRAARWLNWVITTVHCDTTSFGLLVDCIPQLPPGKTPPSTIHPTPALGILKYTEDQTPAQPVPHPALRRSGGVEVGGGGGWRWGWARAAGLDWLQTLKECETCEKLPPCDGRKRRPWIPECVSVLDKVRQILHWWFRSQYCSTAFI